MSQDTTPMIQGLIPPRMAQSDADIEKMRQVALGDDSEGTAAQNDEEADDAAEDDVTDQGGQEVADEPETPDASETIRQQYVQRENQLLANYQQLVNDRNQLQRDYTHAQSWGTRTSQEVAELRQEIQQRDALLAQYSAQLQQLQNRKEYDPLLDDEDSGARVPDSIQRELDALKQEVAGIRQKEQLMEVERRKQAFLQQWDQKAAQWRARGVQDENVVNAAKLYYAMGKIEDAEELVSSHLMSQVLGRVTTTRQRQAATEPLSEEGSGGSGTSVERRRGRPPVLDPETLDGKREWEQSDLRVQHMMKQFFK